MNSGAGGIRWPRQASITRRSGSRRSAPSTRSACRTRSAPSSGSAASSACSTRRPSCAPPTPSPRTSSSTRVREQIHERPRQPARPPGAARGVGRREPRDRPRHDQRRAQRPGLRCTTARAAVGGGSPARPDRSGPSAATRPTAATRRPAHNPLRDLAESAPALNGADLDEPRQPAYPDVQTRMELGPDPLSGGRERAAAPAAASRAELARRHAPQPEVHLRHVRHRREQPLRPRGGGRGRRGPGQGVQPALRLRRVGAGQDAPAPRHRPLRPDDVPERARALRELRGVHQRLHQQHP